MVLHIYISADIKFMISISSHDFNSFNIHSKIYLFYISVQVMFSFNKTRGGSWKSHHILIVNDYLLNNIPEKNNEFIWDLILDVLISHSLTSYNEPVK